MAGAEPAEATTQRVDTASLAAYDRSQTVPARADLALYSSPAGDGAHEADDGAAHDLSSARLLRPHRPAPASGWRRAVWALSGGALNPGESAVDAHRREMRTLVNRPLHGSYKIALVSLKGGVGKTSLTTALGSTFAALRGDRVVALDANPDRGTLAQRVPRETTASVRHLLAAAPGLCRYSDVRQFTSQAPSRLEVLASDEDPAVSEAFSSRDYNLTLDILETFHSIILTDCGTGLMHSAMHGVLDRADVLVVVSSSSIDGARSAAATLDWLDAHGYRELVARSFAAINFVPRGGSARRAHAVDLDHIETHFAARCRHVARVPFDPHLDEGGEIELDALREVTRDALLDFAAVVADGFAPRAGASGPHGLPHGAAALG